MAVFGFGLLVGSVGGGLVIEATLLAANQLPRPGELAVGAAAAAVAVAAWALFLAQIGRSPHPFVDPLVLRARSFLMLCGLGALVQALFVGTGFVLPLALRDLFGHSTAVVGLLTSLGFAAMLARLGGSRLTRSLGPGGTIRVAVGLGAAGALAAAVGGPGHAPVPVAAYGVIGAGYSLAQAVLLGTAGRQLPPDYSGTGMGFYDFCYVAGGALPVAASGGVVERRPGAGMPWTYLHDGAGVAYADAATLLAGVALAAIALLVPLLRDGRTFGPDDRAAGPGAGRGGHAWNWWSRPAVAWSGWSPISRSAATARR